MTSDGGEISTVALLGVSGEALDWEANVLLALTAIALI